MPVDTRFYRPLEALRLETIANQTGTELVGDGTVEITTVSSAAVAQKGEIAFLDGDGKSSQEISSEAGALVVNDANERHVPNGVPYLKTPLPRFVHGQIARQLFQPRQFEAKSDARIASNSTIHKTAAIMPGAVIGPGSAIGEGTVIGANAVIGPGVQIGRNCQIGSNVSVFCALIGDHVKILAGARIGEAGFGVLAGPEGAEDAPHFGRVVIQDHVTIGANSCIDRGVFDDTILGERTRVDNLCQIAHNVVVGRSVLMAAFGGISGSVRIGDGSMLGGRVGVADHVNVGAGASLAASAGLFRDVPDGETWGGTPAKPVRQWMREVAWLQKNANPKKSN